MRFLIVDIGAGTMDVLYYDSEERTHYKAVVRSPVLYMAEKAANVQGAILVTGKEMGGGTISRVGTIITLAPRLVNAAADSRDCSTVLVITIVFPFSGNSLILLKPE